MKKFLLILFITISFIACSKKKTEIPPDVIPMKEMQLLLSDIHLAQSAANNNILADSSLYTAKDFVNYVLKSHNVTREKFLSSMKFYTDNPILLEEVYDSVITELSRMQAESEAQ